MMTGIVYMHSGTSGCISALWYCSKSSVHRAFHWQKNELWKQVGHSCWSCCVIETQIFNYITPAILNPSYPIWKNSKFTKAIVQHHMC